MRLVRFRRAYASLRHCERQRSNPEWWFVRNPFWIASSLRSSQRRVYLNVTRTAILLCITTVCEALPTDRLQIMHFHAETADLNQTTHHGVYRGQVALDQGTTHLRATYATTEWNDKNQLISALAKGEPSTQAHYWVTTDLNKPDLHAYADQIRYTPLQHLIELTGHAIVKQGLNTYAANNILYDTLHQHVISKGDAQHQTEIIIHPEEIK